MKLKNVFALSMVSLVLGNAVEACLCCKREAEEKEQKPGTTLAVTVASPAPAPAPVKSSIDAEKKEVTPVTPFHPSDESSMGSVKIDPNWEGSE